MVNFRLSFLICFCKSKEAHFFDRDSIFSENKVEYSDYHKLFKPSNKTKVIGETTPIYLYWNLSIERIWHYNPDMKIIAVLRNPITRSYSHWQMMKRENYDYMDFSEAIRNEKERLKKESYNQHRWYSYITRGLYCDQIRRVWKYFGKNQCLFLKHDDLNLRHDDVLEQIFTFLGINADVSIKKEQIHAQKYDEMNREDLDYLKDIFFTEISQLEQMLSWDLSEWLSPMKEIDKEQGAILLQRNGHTVKPLS